MRHLSILFWLLLASGSILAQDRRDHWIHGDSMHLAFEGDELLFMETVPFPWTFEGVASMSDTAGDLLFYANSNAVYNREFEVMENGDSLCGVICPESFAQGV